MPPEATRNSQEPEDENGTIWWSKEPSIITTASGGAESTGEARVYVNALGRFVTLLLLED